MYVVLPGVVLMVVIPVVYSASVSRLNSVGALLDTGRYQLLAGIANVVRLSPLASSSFSMTVGSLLVAAVNDNLPSELIFRVRIFVASNLTELYLPLHGLPTQKYTPFSRADYWSDLILADIGRGAFYDYRCLGRNSSS